MTYFQLAPKDSVQGVFENGLNEIKDISEN